MGKIIDITNRQFGRLKVIKIADIVCNPNGLRVTRWQCVCECGTLTVVRSGNLRSGHTQSCGCLAIDRTKEASHQHGLTGTVEHNIWRGMLSRCYNPRVKCFKRYGGRGILVELRWHDFRNFIADMGLRPDSAYILERKDNSLPYGAENCIWADRKTQARNRRSNHFITYNGETKIAIEWAEILQMPYATLFARIKMGWPIEEVFVRPIGKNGKKGPRNL